MVETRTTTEASQGFAAEIAESRATIQVLVEQQQSASAPADAQAQIERIRTETIPQLRKQQLQAIDWRPLWGAPAAFAGIVLLIFIAFFKENRIQESPTL
jgi:uncharacterized membrane-anchored protein